MIELSLDDAYTCERIFSESTPELATTSQSPYRDAPPEREAPKSAMNGITGSTISSRLTKGRCYQVYEKRIEDQQTIEYLNMLTL